MVDQQQHTVVTDAAPSRAYQSIPAKPPLIQPLGFNPYGVLTGATPAIPEYYWNVVSDEQRWKFICINLQNLVDYVNMLASHFPIDTVDLQDGGVTDVKLGADVPDVRAVRTDAITCDPNSATHVVVTWPAHYGVGTPVASAVVENTSDANVTCIITSVSEEAAHITLLNNSSQEAEIRVAVTAWWAVRKDNHNA